MEEEASAVNKSRDFVCACGKNYLSYAALFTHIKQKHQGKAPGPIVRPRSERKRGRPRKIPIPGCENKYSDSDFINNSNGFQIPNQINNSLEYSKRKTQQAAEILLSSGGFKAFQTYQPEGSKLADSRKMIPSKHSDLTDQKLHTKLSTGECAQRSYDNNALIQHASVSRKQLNKIEPQIANHLQSHNCTLTQILSKFNYELSTQYRSKHCSKFGQSVDIKYGTFCYSLSSYLMYIEDFFTSEKYLTVQYILNLFQKFVLTHACQNIADKLREVTIEDGLKLTEDFVANLPQQDANFMLKSAVDTNQSQINQSNNIGVQLAMDVLMLYTYWVGLFTDCKNEYPLSYTQPKKHQKSKQQVSKRQFQHYNQHNKPGKRKREQPIIINNIEDILRDIQYNSEQDFGSDSMEFQPSNLIHKRNSEQCNKSKYIA